MAGGVEGHTRKALGMALSRKPPMCPEARHWWLDVRRAHIQGVAVEERREEPIQTHSEVKQEDLLRAEVWHWGQREAD